MAWGNITEGDFGWVGRLVLTEDGVVQDISSYTTQQFIFRPPTGDEVTVTAQFDTDGTDGALIYTVSPTTIDISGMWEVRARIAKSGVQLTSKAHRFPVFEA